MPEKLPEKKRILICGATGFIGRNMTEYFATKDAYHVTAVYHNRPAFDFENVEWTRADLTSAADVERVCKGVDIIIQAAATTSGSADIVNRPHIHVSDNAVMNSLLLRAAFDHQVGQFIFFSCTVMYQSSGVPLLETDFDESLDIHPHYFGVGWTKVYVEKMCEFFSRLGVTRHTVIRHSNIYGPHDKYDLERSHVFGATIAKAGAARDGKIVVWGTGEEARDLLYVGDLIDFVERAIERQRDSYALYNCGLGYATQIKELAAKIVKVMNPGLAIEHDLRKPTIPTSLALNCDKARKDLGWSPATGLDHGIEKTVAWWREHIGPARR